MNTPEHSKQSGNAKTRLPHGLHRRRAVALVLAVSFIVLLSALVVGFFSRVTTDLASSRSYAEGVNVRQLADSAVGIVMGQIREATSRKNACWASQPGMIRTYRTPGGQAGTTADAFFKLYSSHDLILTGLREINAFDPTLTNPGQSTNAVEVPLGRGGWQEQPAFFTDLNEPVDVPDPDQRSNASKTIKRYPIFDPNVAVIYDTPQSRPTRPWVDGKVEGCEIVLPQASRVANDAPMPVRWMYVLKDGTITTPPPSSNGLVADWQKPTNADGDKTGIPTKDNPIVGRIAFWTDDDSCKVNINTAGGFLLPDGVEEDVNLNYTTASGAQDEKNPGYYAGSFWDTPRVQTRFDRGVNSGNLDLYRGGLANSQPAQNEFQRYPGHPSTTSLGLVFRYLLPPGKTGFNSEKLYALTPRLMPGGSLNGTRYLNVTQDRPLEIKTSYDAAINKTETYHLFASVDELFYSTRNGPRISAVNGINAWAQRQSSPTQGPMQSNTITSRLVDQSRFFITAHSRSPELNLFGRPRVTIWPVPSADRERELKGRGVLNGSDDLIRFCSTVGRDSNTRRQEQTRQGEFIFERRDPYRSGSANNTQDPLADFWQPRNRAIFNYLREVTSDARGQIPGFGKSFESKYRGGPGGRDQILVEIFDYIRTVNQKDGSRDFIIDNETGLAPRTAENNRLKAAARYAPHALVVPTRVTIDGRKLSGFGRYPTISEASLVFYHGGYVCVPKPNSDLAKFASGELQVIPGLSDKGGIQRIPGSGEVMVYDVTRTPRDYDWKTLLPVATPSNQKWIEDNVQNWTGQIIRAFVIFETFNPMQGYAPVDNFANIGLADTKTIGADGKFIRYNYADPTRGVFVHELKINGQFAIQTTGSGGPKSLRLGEGTQLKNAFTRTSGEIWAGRNFGGTEGFHHTMFDKRANNPNAANYYPFQSPCATPLNPLNGGVRVGPNDRTFDFFGGKMDVFLGYQDEANPPHNEQIQKISLTFPDSTGSWLLPTPTFRPDLGGFDPRVTDQSNPPNRFDADEAPVFPTNLTTKWSTWAQNDYGIGGWAMAYNLPSRLAWSSQHSNSPYGPTNKQTGAITGDGHRYANRFLQILQPGDTIRSLVVGGDQPAASDTRIAALQQEVTTLLPHPDYQSATKRRAETLKRGDGGFYFDPSTVFFGTGIYAEAPQKSSDPTTGSFIPLGTARYRSSFGPDLVRLDSTGAPFVAKRYDGQLADFDTGIGNFPDGAFAGKADEGNVAAYWVDPIDGLVRYVEPYFTWVYDLPLDTYFSPNRQLPGPVMFGSLPAPHVPWDQAGWKTLLFCPNPAGANHPGSDQNKTQAPDHLLLDLFNMPVVEPYAISEPFSTAGKVNLNYPMVPFNYIKRTTAIRAALHPLRVTAIPQTFVQGTILIYKGGKSVNGLLVTPDENFRYLVDRDETLKGFDAFFERYKTNKSEGFFKSASQICERYLYPKGPVWGGGTVRYTTNEGNIKAFWDRNQLTGDNVREKPYADLYPRVTTKSNTYTVHYRVQTLRQRPFNGEASLADAHYRTFDEARDKVLAEFRGYATIERYLDPEDARFQPNYNPAADRINVETQSLEDAYRFRIISNKRFSPW